MRTTHDVPLVCSLEVYLFPSENETQHVVLLLQLLHALWVTEGTGDANFYYAASLMMGIAGGMGGGCRLFRWSEEWKRALEMNRATW